MTSALALDALDMTIRLYNTLSRKKETFAPLRPERVTMYVCGPTVYNFAHIGNARPAVVFDVLYRLLQHHYPEVVYARNITDIDDKINAAAQESGEPISEIASRFTAAYHADMGALGVLPPVIEPHATGHVKQIITMIERLIERDNAYEAEGHVLFHVPSDPDYGALSRRDREDMIAGARVEVAPYKKDPADFVLWKPSSGDLPGWDSPWGRGRPGWHIECSAMAAAHLGETIDIHGGGHDLIFPHHENEIAQSRRAHDGKTFARFWVHNGFVNVNQEKMSKSLGNVLLVRDLLDEAPAEAIRWALLAAHYRQPLDWTEEGVQQAKRALDRLYGTLRQLADVEAGADPQAVPESFMAALNDDLNTPKAFAELFELSHAANKAKDKAERGRLKSAILAAGALIGHLQQDPEVWFEGGARDAGIDIGEIERLIEARNVARKDKDFAEADRIRDELAAKGVVIEDRPDGTQWRLAS